MSSDSTNNSFTHVTLIQVVGRLRVGGGSSTSVGGRHSVCLEASHRDVLPLPVYPGVGAEDPMVGSEHSQSSGHLFGGSMLGGNFLNIGPIGSSSNSSRHNRGSSRRSSSAREWAGYGADHWPMNSWPSGLPGSDQDLLNESLARSSLASAEVLAAKPSTKLSASYSWRRDGLVSFQTPSSAGSVPEVQQAPGAVAVSGASFATFAEFAGAGLMHALLAPYTTTAALAARYASGSKDAYSAGGERSSKDSNTTTSSSHTSPTSKAPLSGDAAHFIKVGAAGRWAFPLTGAYEYTLPAPPQPETVAAAAKLRSEDVVDEDAGSTDLEAKCGAAAGAVLNLSVDFGWLCPVSSSPFRAFKAPGTVAPAASASAEGSQRSSHLVDRFFLGGPMRASALLAPPLSGGSSSGGLSGAFTPPAHLGLRGFAIGGCGPRAAAAAAPTPFGGAPSSFKNTSDQDEQGRKHGVVFNGFRNNSSPLFGDALGGDLRCAIAAELSVPAPLPTLAAAGVRGSASVQAGFLAPCANFWSGNHCSNSVLNGTAFNASASVGVGIPLGAGAGVEVLCSKPFICGAQDRPERWQLAIGLGIGS